MSGNSGDWAISNLHFRALSSRAKNPKVKLLYYLEFLKVTKCQIKVDFWHFGNCSNPLALCRARKKLPSLISLPMFFEMIECNIENVTGHNHHPKSIPLLRSKADLPRQRDYHLMRMLLMYYSDILTSRWEKWGPFAHVWWNLPYDQKRLDQC